MKLNTNKIKVLATVVLALFALSLVALPVLAQDDPFGINAANSIGLGNKDLKSSIGSIIKLALGFLGLLAVIIVLIGGFKYMTAGGSDEKVQDARKYIISGIIGLAIILSAYAITSFVISNLITATNADAL